MTRPIDSQRCSVSSRIKQSAQNDTSLYTCSRYSAIRITGLCRPGSIVFLSVKQRKPLPKITNHIRLVASIYRYRDRLDRNQLHCWAMLIDHERMRCLARCHIARGVSDQQPIVDHARHSRLYRDFVTSLIWLPVEDWSPWA